MSTHIHRLSFVLVMLLVHYQLAASDICVVVGAGNDLTGRKDTKEPGADRESVVVPTEDTKYFVKALALTQDDHVAELADGETAPTYDNVVEAVSDAVSRSRPDARLIVYLSSHASPDQSGDVHFMLADSNVSLDSQGYVTSSERCLAFSSLIEMLAESQAAETILFIDSCHSAALEALHTGLAESFNDKRRIAIMFASDIKEKAFIWPESGRSVFTFYVCMGLRGAADKDHDAAISFKELYDYVSRNVERRSELVRQHYRTTSVSASHPQRYQRPTDFDPVFALNPYPFNDHVQETADAIAEALELQDLNGVTIGVPEFTEQKSSADEPGLSSVPFGRILSSQITKALSERGLKVVNPESLTKGIHVRNRSDADLWASKLVDIVVDGKYTGRGSHLVSHSESPPRLQVDITVRHVTRNDVVVLTFSQQYLMTGELSDIVTNRTALESSQLPLAPVPAEVLASPPPDAATRRIDRHPHFRDYTGSPIQFRFIVRRDQQQHVIEAQERGDHCYLPVDQGDELIVQVRNASETHQAVVLMIDGLNVLSRQRSGAKDEWPSQESRLATPEQHLDRGAYWVLAPGNTYEFDSWYLLSNSEPASIQAKAKTRKFQIAEVNESLAHRLSYESQMGDIRAFAYPASKRITDGKGGEAVGAAMGEGEAGNRMLDLSEYRVSREDPKHSVFVFQYRLANEIPER